jgi:anti-sigma B factor antagonist
VVTVSGELDLYSAPQLSAELEAHAASASEVVLDLAGVSFMDSTALGAVLAAARRIRDAGGRLSLVAPVAETRKLLELVGVDRVLPVYETADGALEHLVGSVVLRKLAAE